MNQFTEGIFYPDIITTVGYGLIKKTIELKEINRAIDLELWDTGELIKCRPKIKPYYKNADVIILCYDSTSKYSFDKSYWYEEEIKINVDHDQY